MSNIESGNAPANPTLYMDQRNGVGGLYADNEGLTKREAFAMAAMQGLLANSKPKLCSEEQWCGICSLQAVNHADALLKELSI